MDRAPAAASSSSSSIARGEFHSQLGVGFQGLGGLRQHRRQLRVLLLELVHLLLQPQVLSPQPRQFGCTPIRRRLQRRRRLLEGIPMSTRRRAAVQFGGLGSLGLGRVRLLAARNRGRVGNGGGFGGGRGDGGGGGGGGRMGPPRLLAVSSGAGRPAGGPLDVGRRPRCRRGVERRQQSLRVALLLLLLGGTAGRGGSGGGGGGGRRRRRRRCRRRGLRDGRMTRMGIRVKGDVSSLAVKAVVLFGGTEGLCWHGGLCGGVEARRGR